MQGKYGESARYGDFLVREYEEGDEVRILEAFNRVFAAVNPEFEPRTLEDWNWRFRDNPAGMEIRIAVTEDGEVAGHFAGIRQRMRVEGRAGRFVQGVDNFTDPRFRKSLRRDSLLSFINNTHWELTGGPGPEKSDVDWGLPVTAAWRVGGKLIGYEVIRTQLALAAATDAIDPGPTEGVEVVEASEFPEETGLLFERAAAPYGAIEVRDKEHCDWRFFARPDHGYRLGLARRGGELLGYAVFAVGGFDQRPDQGLVVDWLVPPTARPAGHALRAWIRALAQEAGVERAVALFPETAADFLAFQLAGFRVEPTSYFPIGRIYSKRHEPRWLYRNWYYTFADTDLA